MLYEIRNYHFNPELFEDYKAWAKSEATPFLKDKLDIVGFWVDTGIPAELNGEPLDALGSANITWIIRWEDMAQRESEFEATLGSPEWADIFSRVPGGLDSYRRREAKFFEEL
jgi:hypothetical protein